MGQGYLWGLIHSFPIPADHKRMHHKGLKTDHAFLSFAKTNSRSGDWNRYPGSQGSSDESGLKEMNGLVVSTMGLTG